MSRAVVHPDTRALTVAQWLQTRVQPRTVLLFGSRARGDWSADSDIDLAVLSPAATPTLAPGEPGGLAATLRPAVTRLFGHPVDVQIFPFTQAEFNWARTSPNHVAGGVQRDGLNPEGRPLAPIKQHNPWPDVQTRLRSVHASLYDALKSEGYDMDRGALFDIANAVENGLKAYASACGLRYRKTHDLKDLAARIQAVDQAVALPEADWLEDLAEFRHNALYEGDYPLTLPMPATLGEAQDLCSRLAARALALCDKTPAQVRYVEQTYATWDPQRPLAGLEDADRTCFQVAGQIAESRVAGHEEGRQEGRKEALLDMARIVCDDTNRVVALAQYLDSVPPTDWPSLQDVWLQFGQADPPGHDGET